MYEFITKIIMGQAIL